MLVYSLYHELECQLSVFLSLFYVFVKAFVKFNILFQLTLIFYLNSGELQPVLYISQEELRNQVAELHT